MNRLKSIFSAATCAGALLALSVPAQAEFDLSILHWNDMHSRMEAINRFDSGCRAKDDVAGKCFGGAARLKTAVDNRRGVLSGAGKNVLTVIGGDQFSGSLYFTTYKGQMNAEVLNMIGVDAMALGNHEFDNFKVDPSGLKNFADKVDFPLLFANADISGEAALTGAIDSHFVKDFGGEKVAMIGILTPDTVEIASPGDNIKFLSEEETLNKLIGELKADGVNKIVLVTHIGFQRDLELAATVPGIDVIVGGHDNTLPDEYPTMVDGPDGNKVAVVQAYAYSKYLGELTVTFDDDGNVTEAGGRPWLLDAMVPADPAMTAYIKEAAAPLDAIKNEVVGSAATGIEGNRDVCRVGICSMGVLVADAMLDRVKDQGVSISIANSGGLRASIDAGEVTMGEVLTVLPFQNTLATFELKGADVIAALENGVSQVEKKAGRFPQVAGIEYVWNPSAEPGSRIVSVTVKAADGSMGPIDPAATYGVVSNNYMRNGGDGYKIFATGGMNAYDYGPSLEDVVAEYIGEAGSYNPYVDGRISTAN